MCKINVKTEQPHGSDGQFAREENDSIQLSVKFDSIFPVTASHNTMPLYKHPKFSKFKHTIKHKSRCLNSQQEEVREQ